MSVRAACEAFGVSETCYRYQAKRCPENGVIAELTCPVIFGPVET